MWKIIISRWTGRQWEIVASVSEHRTKATARRELARQEREISPTDPYWYDGEHRYGLLDPEGQRVSALAEYA